MNFQQFYPLLRSLFTKEDVGIEPTSDNFPLFLAMRNISFVHPNLCVFMDEVLNSFKKLQLFSDPVLAYNTLKSLLPKLPYNKIDYVKKPVTVSVRNKELTNEELQQLAGLLEVSKREVLLYISMMPCQKQ